MSPGIGGIAGPNIALRSNENSIAGPAGIIGPGIPGPVAKGSLNGSLNGSANGSANWSPNIGS